MSKLANPWKCDASGCGMLRANDTNHWMLLRVIQTICDSAPRPTIRIEPWADKLAGRKDVKHACGIDCGLKIAAQLIVENFFPNTVPSTGKDVADG
jgi:hypothetical protein